MASTGLSQYRHCRRAEGGARGAEGMRRVDATGGGGRVEAIYAGGGDGYRIKFCESGDFEMRDG
jgi:hypothetical protein